jgi:hypothetical protein
VGEHVTLTSRILRNGWKIYEFVLPNGFKTVGETSKQRALIRAEEKGWIVDDQSDKED